MFDYKFLGRCQYPVPAPHHPEGETDCGEPAVVYGWWDDYGDGWLLCQEHLDYIIKREKKDVEETSRPAG